MKKIILALLLATTANFACAQFITGANLMEWINEYNQVQVQGQLKGSAFNSGALLGHVWTVADDAKFKYFCLPQGVTGVQLVAVIEKYLRANPEKWNHGANLLSAVALMDAFPCPKK